MMDPMGLQLLARLRRDDFLREARSDFLADQLAAPPKASFAARAARLGHLGAAVVAAIIGRSRARAGLESTRG